MKPLRLALTADLHFGGRHSVGTEATRLLAADLYADPPDLLILAGDIGAGEDFARCLELFAGLSCRKALVPGNHDIWVRREDVRGNSQIVYEEWLPKIAREHGFVYLDQEPFLLPEYGLGIVGNINWYDYTWDNDRLRQVAPHDWERRLQTKRFSRGQHNDANFVVWPWTDQEFTDRMVGTLQNHLSQTLAQVPQALVIMHHPPLHGLLYPAQEPLELDALLWRAFSGNTRVESLIRTHADRIPFVFCGHTHFARECQEGPMRGINIGGDYEFKRLVRLEWPTGTVTAQEFDPRVPVHA